MSVDEFWTIVAKARQSAGDSSDAEEVAERTLALLSALPPEQIAALARPLWDLRARSYRWELWQAAYLINGGCSDDGFEYFRGWLLAQGRETFELAVADPDTLAELLAVQRVAADGEDLECESMYGVVWDAYEAATGSIELPCPVTGRYPELGPGWDFEDADEVRRRLPRLAALFAD
ncbi:DUF4240 domain-containing protein [Catellatospora aurea]|uniref:DUF4240 domain-containing protein n=1 Tax=Catellatospora aurea TaxID=1337874 RepID=A0ABW2GV09_9ACTN